MPDACPPSGPNSFVSAYIFTEKHPCRRSTPPHGSILPTGNPGSATNSFPTDQPNRPEQVRLKDGPFLIVKDTDGTTVWSDGPRNKYDTEKNIKDKFTHGI